MTDKEWVDSWLRGIKQKEDWAGKKIVSNPLAVLRLVAAEIERLKAAHELSRQCFLTHEAAGSCLTADGGQGLADVPSQLRDDCDAATTAWLSYWRAAEQGGE